jgi:protein-S-isoprenylcysteine O-methyltransferase Ste14
MAQTETQPPQQSPESLAKALLSLVIWFAFMVAAMFGTAGTWDWPRGQVFFAVYVALTLIACAWLWAVNPEIFAARRKIQKGTKAWDVVLTCVIVIAFVGLIVVPALDDGRFHWAPQPDWVVWLGYVLFAPGFMGFAWAQAVNRHFEASVRIQTDRGHQVISTGPYAIVRHPGYAFAILMLAGMPLAMGSVVGLIPAGVLFLLVLVRTLGEDATLKAELPGYKEYAQRVKSRWIPGVW